MKRHSSVIALAAFLITPPCFLARPAKAALVFEETRPVEFNSLGYYIWAGTIANGRATFSVGLTGTTYEPGLNTQPIYPGTDDMVFNSMTLSLQNLTPQSYLLRQTITGQYARLANPTDPIGFHIYRMPIDTNNQNLPLIGTMQVNHTAADPGSDPIMNTQCSYSFAPDDATPSTATVRLYETANAAGVTDFVFQIDLNCTAFAANEYVTPAAFTLQVIPVPEADAVSSAVGLALAGLGRRRR